MEEEMYSEEWVGYSGRIVQARFIILENKK